MTGPGRPRRIRFGQSGAQQGAGPFGLSGIVAGVLLIGLFVGTVVWSAASDRPAAAEKPQLFGGSVVLEDTRPLTVVDVATARITVRLDGVYSEVGASNYGSVQPVPVEGGTFLVDRKSGSFNFLEQDDYVTDPNGPGVGLGRLAGARAAVGLAAGPDAYIVRSAPASTVSLVGRQTVAAAAKAVTAAGPAGGTGTRRVVTASPAAAVSPVGFAALDGSVGVQPGASAVAGRDLWALTDRSGTCAVEQLDPPASGRQALTVYRRGTAPAPCSRDAVETDGATVAVAGPGRVQLYPPGVPAAGSATARPTAVRVPATAGATSFVPVADAPGSLWFLVSQPAGWSLLRVDAGGATSMHPLGGFSARAAPVVPVYSNGFLYTLDQAQGVDPELWAIDAATGRMAPVRGQTRYPVLHNERVQFTGAEAVGRGPRVVFNNPQSHEAVVVFTDGSSAPVVVDKSRAVDVSTTGPADLNATTVTTRPGRRGKGTSKSAANSTTRTSTPVPVQDISQQVTCANTTQKPYVPQIQSVAPSSGAALIQWSYQLLDQTDCEPATWAVQVKAVSGSHQPANPVQVVNGQQQYLFTGLRPSTEYQVIVTAYINSQSTPSNPVTFTTSARGPDAPLSVATQADANGDWIVSWSPCTEAAHPNCVVPADQWNVIGTSCGSGFVGTPPTVQVAGGTDTVTINSDQLGLLGDSLSFSVEGSVGSGLTGNPTSDHACTQAWRKPNAAAISLTQESTAAGNSVSATLTVGTSGNPIEAFGSNTTEFVYSAGGRTVGPVTATRATIDNLPAGEALPTSVEVYPAGHPGAAVTIAGPAVNHSLPWPDLYGANAVGTVDPNPNTGTVTVHLPADAPAPLQATGADITCGSAQYAQPDEPVSGTTFTYAMPDLVDSGGACSLTVTLQDTANPNPYNGETPPQLNLPFSIGTMPTYTFTDHFTGSCDQGNPCGLLSKQQVEVDSDPAPSSMTAGGDWSVASQSDKHGGPADLCASGPFSLTGPSFPFYLDVPTGCDPQHFDVVVTYKYLGQVVPVDAGTPNGQPPTIPTTTTTSTTTTTTVPCPTTTTSSSTTSTSSSSSSTSSSSSSSSSSSTSSSTSSTTTACTPGGGPGGAARTAAAASAPATYLATARTGADAHVDPFARDAIGWIVAVLGLAWVAGQVRRTARRRSRRGT